MNDCRAYLPFSILENHTHACENRLAGVSDLERSDWLSCAPCVCVLCAVGALRRPELAVKYNNTMKFTVAAICVLLAIAGKAQVCHNDCSVFGSADSESNGDETSGFEVTKGF